METLRSHRRWFRRLAARHRCHSVSGSLTIDAELGATCPGRMRLALATAKAKARFGKVDDTDFKARTPGAVKGIRVGPGHDPFLSFPAHASPVAWRCIGLASGAKDLGDNRRLGDHIVYRES
jgi:hypothetical protein